MPIKQVLEARPDMRLVAEYPSEGRLDIFTNRVEVFFFKNIILKVANLLLFDCVAATPKHLMLI
jgi:hypothetical protein